MSVIDELVAAVRAQADADELWATEASRKHGNPVVDGGEHWHWECNKHDLPAMPQPGQSEFLETGQCDCFSVSLRSQEEYPSGNSTLPHFALPTCEEVPSAVGGHIARHSPARVLREVSSRRALLDEALAWEHGPTNTPWPCDSRTGEPCDCGRDARVTAVLRHLAAPYTEET